MNRIGEAKLPHNPFIACRVYHPTGNHLRFSSFLTVRSSSSILRKLAFSSSYCVSDSVILSSQQNFTVIVYLLMAYLFCQLFVNT